jgi:hypothetical protein
LIRGDVRHRPVALVVRCNPHILPVSGVSDAGEGV